MQSIVSVRPLAPWYILCHSCAQRPMLRRRGNAVRMVRRESAHPSLQAQGRLDGACGSVAARLRETAIAVRCLRAMQVMVDQRRWADALSTLPSAVGVAPRSIDHFARVTIVACGCGGRWSEAMQLLHASMQAGVNVEGVPLASALTVCARMGRGSWHAALKLVQLARIVEGPRSLALRVRLAGPSPREVFDADLLSDQAAAALPLATLLDRLRQLEASPALQAELPPVMWMRLLRQVRLAAIAAALESTHDGRSQTSGQVPPGQAAVLRHIGGLISATCPGVTQRGLRTALLRQADAAACVSPSATVPPTSGVAGTSVTEERNADTLPWLLPDAAGLARHFAMLTQLSPRYDTLVPLTSLATLFSTSLLASQAGRTAREQMRALLSPASNVTLLPVGEELQLAASCDEVYSDITARRGQTDRCWLLDEGKWLALLARHLCDASTGGYGDGEARASVFSRDRDTRRHCALVGIVTLP